MPINPYDTYEAQFFRTSGREIRPSHVLSNISTPLDEEIKSWELKRVVSLGRVNYIPHLEGADARPAVLKALAMASPTLAACNKAYQTYAYKTSRLELVPNASVILNPEQDTRNISPQSRLQYNEFLIKTLGRKGHRELVKNILGKTIDNLLYYGNSWLEMRIDENAGFAVFQVYDGDWGRYLRPDNPDEKLGDRIVICEDFLNVNNNMEVNFEIIGAFPNFTRDPQTGILRTIIHSKTDAVGHNFYGLPYSSPCVMHQMKEYQSGLYGVVEHENQFTAKLFIESEATKYNEETIMDENGEPISAQKAMEMKRERFSRLFTNKGGGEDKKFPVMFAERYNGASPSTIFAIPQNSDSDFHKFSAEDSEAKILMTCGVNPIILNSKNGGLADSGNALYQAGLSFMETQVKALQEDALSGLRTALEFLEEAFNFPNPEMLTISLSPPAFLDTLKPKPVEQPQAPTNAQEAKPQLPQPQPQQNTSELNPTPDPIKPV